MTRKMKKWLRPALFALGGCLAGMLYYHYFGCTNSCPISSSLYVITVYMGVIGLLLSYITSKEKD